MSWSGSASSLRRGCQNGGQNRWSPGYIGRELRLSTRGRLALPLELHGPKERQRLHLDQRACWQVAAEYGLVHRVMSQPPVRDYLPASWTNLAHVKAEHFSALAHYHTAMALCEGSCECVTPHACVSPQRLSAHTHGLSDPQQPTRESSQDRHTPSSPQLPVSPKVPHCRSIRKSAGSLVRHHRQGPGPNVAGCPHSHSSAGIPGLVETAERGAPGSAGQVGTYWGQLFPCSTVWLGRTFLIWPTLSDLMVLSLS